MSASRTLAVVGLLLGITGLVIQSIITIGAYLADGRDLPGALGTFFSFYTILSNTVLVLIYLAHLLPNAPLSLLRHPVVRGLMAANMMLVMLYVFFVLRHLNVLEGWFLICDYILHYISPIVYVAWWVATPGHGVLALRDLPLMLAPTFVYFLYAMLRGLWVMEYPYPILDAVELGYAQVVLNAVTMTAGLATLCLIVVALDRWLGRNNASTAAKPI